MTEFHCRLLHHLKYADSIEIAEHLPHTGDDIQFLRDLGYIDEVDVVTPKGLALLRSKGLD